MNRHAGTQARSGGEDDRITGLVSRINLGFPLQHVETTRPSGGLPFFGGGSEWENTPFVMMPHMRRRFFYLVAALSALLWGATPTLWVRSYWSDDTIPLGTRGDTIHLNEGGKQADFGKERFYARSNKGVLELGMYRQVSFSMSAFAQLKNHDWRFIELGYRTERYGAIVRAWHVAVPYWLVWLSITAVWLPWFVRWLKQVRRMRRKNRGLCLNCGYDLRASRERCPECGTAIAQVDETCNAV